MRTIDITTSQKVTISYEISSFQERLMSYIIDILVILASILVLWIFYKIFFSGLSPEYFTYFFSYPVFFLYTLVSESIFNGQTIGKKALGIKVIKLDGTELSTSDYGIRWVFRSVDIYLSLGSIAALLVSSSEHGQRLGDRLSNTTVIRTRSKLEFNLKDILSIRTSENYEPVYKEVKRLNEDDVVLIKKTIDRFQKYPNPSHTHAIRLMVTKVCELLNIPEPQKNKLKFLKTLLKDYVVLTR